jgi:hypothetical protein
MNLLVMKIIFKSFLFPIYIYVTARQIKLLTKSKVAKEHTCIQIFIDSFVKFSRYVFSIYYYLVVKNNEPHDMRQLASYD